MVPVLVSLVAAEPWAIPKSGQTHKALPGHQGVGRFDVAMHQPGGVRRVQRGRQLLNHL
jgi:hypothetical protein